MSELMTLSTLNNPMVTIIENHILIHGIVWEK